MSNCYTRIVGAIASGEKVAVHARLTLTTRVVNYCPLAVFMKLNRPLTGKISCTEKPDDPMPRLTTSLTPAPIVIMMMESMRMVTCEDAAPTPAR
ncbi:MAG: hypothetical protein IPK79_03405 [Vampirovibrionales bacterium]|nr:hypothetical protein [Vampirovibrionales bacterium]